MFLQKVLPIITVFDRDTANPSVAHFQYYAESEPNWVGLVRFSLSGWLVRLLALF